jgi:hypothetical protein
MVMFAAGVLVGLTGLNAKVDAYRRGGGGGARCGSSGCGSVTRSATGRLAAVNVVSGRANVSLTPDPALRRAPTAPRPVRPAVPAKPAAREADEVEDVLTALPPDPVSVQAATGALTRNGIPLAAGCGSGGCTR